MSAETALLIEILIKIVVAISVMGISLLAGFGLWRLVEIPLRRSRASLFDYVYIDDEGNARELDAAEHEYVTTALFLPDDGDQIIKPNYDSRTRDGRLRGYLLRRQLPRRLAIAAPRQ